MSAMLPSLPIHRRIWYLISNDKCEGQSMRGDSSMYLRCVMESAKDRDSSLE